MVTNRESATVDQLGTSSIGVHPNSRHITLAKVKNDSAPATDGPGDGRPG